MKISHHLREKEREKREKEREKRERVKGSQLFRHDLE